MQHRIMGDLRSLLWLIATLCLAAAPTLAHSVEFDIAQLMRLLSASPTGEVSYTEKKFSSLLATPVTSTGKLVYRKPDTVEKNVATPKKESYHFVGQDLLVTRGAGAERRIPLSSQPLLSAFAASLRGTLGGDLAMLRNYFELNLQGDASAWRLDMTPIDSEISRYVKRITASGKGGIIAQIEVREASGDQSIMQIR